MMNRHERRKKITIARRLEKKQAQHRIRRLVLQMAQHHHNHKWEHLKAAEAGGMFVSHHAEGAKLQCELLKAAEAEIAAERNEY